MLELSKSTVISTRLYPIHSSVIALEEGVALVAALENGALTAKPSAGVAGEVFVGVSQNRHVTPVQANGTFSTIVPGTAPYTIQLAKTPINAASVNVRINGVAATQGAVAAGVYSVSGSTLTFAAADAGKPVEILFRYALTQAEAGLLFGSEPVSLNLAAGVQSTAIYEGTIYTDNFDVSADWSNATVIKLGPNGKFTTSGTGTVVNAIVAEIPTSAGGFLGLMLQP